MTGAVEHHVRRAALCRHVNQIETEGRCCLSALSHGFADRNGRGTREARAAGNKQADRPGSYNMGAVSEAHLAPTNRVHRYSEGLDKRGPLEVERSRQRHQVVAGHRQQLGRATVHIYPNEAETIADMGAAAATGPTGAAWKKRVDEHRCPNLQVAGCL
jgi:hypothetical protein